MRWKQPFFRIASLVLLAAPALAVDGVREINQTCATTTGCFTGDAGGLPVTITQPGSYRLTGNVSTANVSTDVITVNASGVSIDLNGFTVSGVTSCPSACAPVGSGRGIAVVSDTLSGVAVRNGTVTMVGSTGIQVGRSGHVEDVRVIGTGGFGILADDASEILRCSVERTLKSAIAVTGDGTLVADNTVIGVAGDFLAIWPGISATEGVVRGNTVRLAFGLGIDTVNALVSGNTVTDNFANGLRATGTSLVSDNVVQGTLEFGPTTGYRDNVFTATGGFPGFGGVNLGGNLCNGALCP